MECGADVTAVDVKGKNAMHYAASIGAMYVFIEIRNFWVAKETKMKGYCSATFLIGTLFANGCPVKVSSFGSQCTVDFEVIVQPHWLL